MDHDGTCVRCGAAVAIGDRPEWSPAQAPEALRQQGWVGFRSADGPHALHLECLTYAESEALLGPDAAAAAAPRAERTGRFSRATPASVSVTAGT